MHCLHSQHSTVWISHRSCGSHQGLGTWTSSSNAAARSSCARLLQRRPWSVRQQLRLLVYAAKSKGGSSRGSKGGKGSGSSSRKRGHQDGTKGADAKNPIAQMQEFKRDEILMFEPVRAARDALSIIYAYPNEYTVGICSLGYQLVWQYFETRPDVTVARLFTDAHDSLPQRPNLLGFSFSWELDYVNILSQLEQLGIPTLAADRTMDHPLVFGGGPVLTANPEPYAAFFDVVLLGDGEDVITAFLAAYEAARPSSSAGFHTAANGSGNGTASSSESIRSPDIEEMDDERAALLRALAQVPGVYCPALYRVDYTTVDGEISSIVPRFSDVPPSVAKQTYRGEHLATSTVVSPKMAWENIYMVEVVRSCPEMCRFCMASYLTLPFRTASVQGSLVPAIERGLAATDRIGLLGASVTQHPEFTELLDYMMEPQRRDVRLSIASVRTNTVTPHLAATLASRGTKSLTVAVESGSERVRRIVNKKLAQEDIAAAARNALAGGLEGLKLYGMVGIPGEAEEDVDATVEMMARLRTEAPGLRLTLGCSTFVPKSHTPFQWFGVDKAGDKRLKKLDKALGRAGVQFRPESYKWSLVQAMLSRGDRRLTAVLLQARTYGDKESFGAFRRAFKELDGTLPPLQYYVHRNLEPGAAVLPWSHLSGPLPEATLVKHAQEAMSHMSLSAEGIPEPREVEYAAGVL